MTLTSARAFTVTSIRHPPKVKDQGANAKTGSHKSVLSRCLKNRHSGNIL